MRIVLFLIIPVVIAISFCSFSQSIYLDDLIPTATPENTVIPIEIPTNTPFPDATELTELSIKTSSAMTGENEESVQPIMIPGADCIPNNQRMQAWVSNVLDGATIEVDMDGRIMAVRYIGLDTSESVIPEKPVQVFSEEALLKNKEFVSGKQIIMIKDISMSDGYGRLLTYVITDQYFVNYEMIKQGYALSADYPPDVACSTTFQIAEMEAQKNKAGLWRDNLEQVH